MNDLKAFCMTICIISLLSVLIRVIAKPNEAPSGNGGQPFPAALSAYTADAALPA